MSEANNKATFVGDMFMGKRDVLFMRSNRRQATQGLKRNRVKFDTVCNFLGKGYGKRV